jgi:hypothetical protein
LTDINLMNKVVDRYNDTSDKWFDYKLKFSYYKWKIKNNGRIERIYNIYN